MRNIYIIIIVAFVLAACNGRKNKELIPKEDLIDLLIEIHLYDAVALDYKLNSRMEEVDSTILYSSIFAKYNTNRAMFDSTIHWYSRKPEELAQIYDIVFGKLDKRNEELNMYSELFQGSKGKDIWKSFDYTHILGDTANYPEPYIIETDGKGTYMFNFKVRVLNEDKSENPYLVIYFIKNKEDSKPEERLEVCRSLMVKSNFIRDYQYVFHLEDESYKFIKAIVPETPDRDKGKNKNIQINKMHIFKLVDESEVAKE